MRSSSSSRAADSMGRRAAFTLVELLVSTSILALLMALLLSSVNQTQQIWLSTTAKVSQFQGARSAFESLTRNLSQATLNTYYGVQYKQDPLDPSKYDPVAFHRDSDLHFVSGRAFHPKLLGGDQQTYPTHAVFFQAPIGTSSDTVDLGGQKVLKYRNLSNLLCAVGYYIKWGPDEGMPPFLSTILPEKRRFRLMHVVQPAETLMVYDTKSLSSSSTFTSPTDWIQVALGRVAPPPRKATPSSHVLAENVIALVLLPKLAERDRLTPTTLDLAKTYDYDTHPQDPPFGPKGVAKKVDKLTDDEFKQFNQLPPIMQVTMVAIDEVSAARQQDKSDSAPSWTQDLFQKVSSEADFVQDLGDPVDPDPEKSLTGRLASATPRVNYRVYSMDVVIRGAKWAAEKKIIP